MTCLVYRQVAHGNAQVEISVDSPTQVRVPPILAFRLGSVDAILVYR